MQIFENFDGQTFKLNNKKYVKNFIVMPIGTENIAVYNAYDSKLQLLSSSHFSEVKVNNASFPNQRVLIDTLAPMIFSKVVYSDGILPNQLIDVSEIIRNGNQLRIETAVWRIDGVVMSIPQPFTTSIQPASNDRNRIDIVVAKSDGTLMKIQGEESQDVASQPLLPANSLFVTSINIFGETIEPQTPVIGNEFIKKSTLGDVLINNLNSQILPNVGKSNFIIRNTESADFIGLSDSQFTTSDSDNWLVIGTEIKITCHTNFPQKLIHGTVHTNNIPFNFPNGQNLEMANNTIAVFRYNGNSLMFESYSFPEQKFIQKYEKGQANGVATLDNNGKIPVVQIPQTPITTSFLQSKWEGVDFNVNSPSPFVGVAISSGTAITQSDSVPLAYRYAQSPYIGETFYALGSTTNANSGYRWSIASQEIAYVKETLFFILRPLKYTNTNIRFGLQTTSFANVIADANEISIRIIGNQLYGYSSIINNGQQSSQTSAITLTGENFLYCLIELESNNSLRFKVKTDFNATNYLINSTINNNIPLTNQGVNWVALRPGIMATSDVQSSDYLLQVGYAGWGPEKPNFLSNF